MIFDISDVHTGKLYRRDPGFWGRLFRRKPEYRIYLKQFIVGGYYLDPPGGLAPRRYLCARAYDAWVGYDAENNQMIQTEEKPFELSDCFNRWDDWVKKAVFVRDITINARKEHND